MSKTAHPSRSAQSLRFSQPDDIFQLRVSLIDIEPPIWRRLLVPQDLTLPRLHTILQVVMGWTGSHLHQFKIVVGYRTSGTRIATLLLGLYSEDGTLDFVGHTSGIPEKLEAQLRRVLPPLAEQGHVTGERIPGAQSRWSRGRVLPWVEVRPELVCEVRFDKLEAERFRHGTRCLRFRPDKDPREHTWDQVRPTRAPGDPTIEELLPRESRTTGPR